MNSTPAEVIRQVLLDYSLGGAGGEDWTTFVSYLPDLPDKAICVYDTAGRFDGRLMTDGTQIEHPGIQVRVRGLIYRETWLKAQNIALQLDAVRKISVVTSTSDEYILHNVSRTGALVPVGVEDVSGKRRLHFTINMVLTLQFLGETFPLALGGDEGGGILLSGHTV